jgi:mono/diheme cytochrome c family protein
MPPTPDYYYLLGIEPDASDVDIRAAHMRAASYWHPDRNKSPDALSMMQHVNSARDTLLNPSRRRTYNLSSLVYQKWQERNKTTESSKTSTDTHTREKRTENASDAGWSSSNKPPNQPPPNPTKNNKSGMPNWVKLGLGVVAFSIFVAFVYILVIADEPTDDSAAFVNSASTLATNTPTTVPISASTFPTQPPPSPTATITSTSIPVPSPTVTPIPTVIPEQITGADIFYTNCTSCHSTGDNKVVGPGLAGIGDRAGSQVAGMSADEYIEQSIREPSAFVVDGYPAVMPEWSRLGDDSIDALVAYLKTLE